MYSFFMVVMILISPHKQEHKFRIYSPAAYVNYTKCQEAGDAVVEYIQSHLPKKGSVKVEEAECRKQFRT